MTLAEASLARIEKLLERIAVGLEQRNYTVGMYPPPTNVDVLDNFRARCPGCGNLKGKRHNQGCVHIVRKPARMKP